MYNFKFSNLKLRRFGIDTDLYLLKERSTPQDVIGACLTVVISLGERLSAFVHNTPKVCILNI
jgi:hypothetical protein